MLWYTHLIRNNNFKKLTQKCPKFTSEYFLKFLKNLYEHNIDSHSHGFMSTRYYIQKAAVG